MTTIVKDYNYWLEVIKRDGWDLKFVPEELKAYELCLEAIKEDGRTLQFVPEEFKTKELCSIAIKNNGWALMYAPEEHKTKELCLEAVKRDGWALRYVPEELKTKELQLIALDQNPSAINFINTNTLPISEWKVEWFERLWNTELKRQFIRERGKEVLDRLGLEEVDKNEEYKLVKFKYRKDQEDFQKALIYKCPSSNDTYLTEVSKRVRTIKEALRFLNNGSNKEELEFES